MRKATVTMIINVMREALSGILIAHTISLVNITYLTFSSLRWIGKPPYLTSPRGKGDYRGIGE